MSVGYIEFQAEAQRIWNSFPLYATRAAEWAAVIAGVAADTRTNGIPACDPARGAEDWIAADHVHESAMPAC